MALIWIAALLLIGCAGRSEVGSADAKATREAGEAQTTAEEVSQRSDKPKVVCTNERTTGTPT